MNKQKLILPVSIAVGCIILGGFYYSGKKQESIIAKRIQSSEELNKTKENNYFEKNKQCFDYASNIKEQNIYWEDVSVFYSPKIDSCALSYITYKASEDGLRYVPIFVIKNLLNSSIIFNENNFAGWEEKIWELKHQN